jgi:L-alanine-DL-glutamate epimerase-like enolase superfamily enzyme
LKVDLRVCHAPLSAPLRSAADAVETRPLVLLTLADSALGISGYGEAAPLQGYDGVSVAQVVAALERCTGVLERASAGDVDVVLQACSQVTVLPQALAAIDLALWDLAGRAAGEPVWRLLGSAEPQPVVVNATIGAEEPGAAAHQAQDAAADGFGCVKVKVGVGDDLARVQAVREAVGPDVAIRVDANGSWDVARAIAVLGLFDPVGLELCEEPVHGLAPLAAVADAVEPPISVDESASDADVFSQRYCDAICLKVSRCGGITGVIRDAAAARAVGYRVYLASTLDGPLGISAALHAAAIVKPDLPSGLATLDRFEASASLPPRRGLMTPPDGTGLGEGLVGWYQ